MKVIKYVLIIVIFITCHNDGGYKQSIENEWKYGLIFSFIGNSNNTKIVATLQDNKDGTISYIQNNDSEKIKYCV